MLIQFKLCSLYALYMGHCVSNFVLKNLSYHVTKPNIEHILDNMCFYGPHPPLRTIAKVNLLYQAWLCKNLDFKEEQVDIKQPFSSSCRN